MKWRDLLGGRTILLALFVGGGILLVIGVLLIPPARLTGPAVNLLTALVWPYVLLLAILFFRPQFSSLLSALMKRVQSGAAFETPFLKVAALIEQRLPELDDAEPVTLKDIALLHTSFISPTATREYNDGRTYYQFEVVVVAPDSVMDRIKLVTYHMDESWQPKLRKQEISDRRSRFKMKELANGTSIVRADISLHEQDKPISLNRFIDLRPEGPRI